MLLRSSRAVVLAASLVLIPISASGAPSKQEAAAAQEAIKQGTAAEKKNDWAGARDAFQTAVDKHDTPDARLHLARAEAKLGHLTEALDHYKTLLDMRVVPAATRAAATKERQALAGRVGRITVKLPSGFSGTVKIDSLQLSPDTYGQAIEVNPGTRVVVAESSNGKTFKKSVDLAEKGSEVVEVHLNSGSPDATSNPETDEGATKVSTSDPGTRSKLPYIALGVGAVGLGVGIGFGLAARSNRKSLEDACPNDHCAADSSIKDTYDSGKRQADISTIGFAVGIVGLGAGVYLLLTQKPADKPPSDKAFVSPFVGPSSVGFHGKF